MSKKTDESELINFLVEATKNVRTPLNITQLAKDFENRSGASETARCLQMRIIKVRSSIHILRIGGLNTEMKLMFALSAPVNADYLKELRKFATVEVDEQKRITKYKTNNGSIDLKGDHSKSKKLKAVIAGSEHCSRKVIADFFNLIDCDDNNGSRYKKEMVALIKFVTARCENIISPLNIRQLMKDFQSHSGTSTPLITLFKKTFVYRREIQNIAKMDVVPKVNQLFGLSALLIPDCLEELRKDASVEVDEKNRITHYKANDGSLELRGQHSLSSKLKAGHAESERCLRKHIVDFMNGIACDGDNDNQLKTEMNDLITFLTKKCKNANSPLNIRRLAMDFKSRSGTSRNLKTLEKRIYAYRHEIQAIANLDPVSKAKQLFGLSASLNSNCLREFRKDALVEVDDKSKITKYVSNDGKLNLQGAHWGSGQRKTTNTVSKKNRKKIQTFDASDDSEDGGQSDEDDTDEESLEEMENEEKSSDEETDEDTDGESYDGSDYRRSLIQREDRDDFSEPINQADNPFDTDYDTLMQNREESIEEETDEDEESELNAGDTTGGVSTTKERNGRLSRRRHLDSDFMFNSSNSQSTSSIQEEHQNGLEHPKSAKKKKRVESRGDSLNPFKYNSFDIDYDPSVQDQVESMEEEMNEDKENESDAGDTTEEESTVKTRCGRSSRRRHLDSDFSYISRNSQSTSAASLENTPGSKLPRSAKKKKRVESRGRAPTPLESKSSALATYSSKNLRKSTRNQAPPDERDSLDEPTENQDIPRDDQELFDYNGPMIQEMEPDDNNRIFIDPEDPPEDCNNPSDGAQEEAPMEEVKPPTEAEESQNTVEKEVKPENQESGTSQELNGNDFVPLSSHIRLLEALQTIMITRNVPDLQEHQTRIERTIEKFKEKGIEEEKITINEIRTSLMNTLLIVNKGARKEVIKGEETTSLKEFLIAFYGFVVHLNLKSLDNFSSRLKAMMEELTEEDKKFPIKNVSIGLLSILVVVAP